MLQKGARPMNTILQHTWASAQTADHCVPAFAAPVLIVAAASRIMLPCFGWLYACRR